MEKLECKFCNKKFETEESLAQHVQAKHNISENEKKQISNKRIKKYFLLFLVVIALILVSYTFYIRAKQPGIYDDFAKCLTEKEAVIYGNDFCSYTNQQLNMFGNSKKLLNYVKCIDNEELCDSKSVDVTPTWEIDGKMYEQVQSFDRLSQLSGCEI